MFLRAGTLSRYGSLPRDLDEAGKQDGLNDSPGVAKHLSSEHT